MKHPKITLAKKKDEIAIFPSKQKALEWVRGQSMQKDKTTQPTPISTPNTHTQEKTTA